MVFMQNFRVTNCSFSLSLKLQMICLYVIRLIKVMQLQSSPSQCHCSVVYVKTLLLTINQFTVQHKPLNFVVILCHVFNWFLFPYGNGRHDYYLVLTKLSFPTYNFLVHYTNCRPWTLCYPFVIFSPSNYNSHTCRWSSK